MKFTRRSPLTGKLNVLELEVTEEQLLAWGDGAYIEDALSQLSPSECEFILTGYTEEDWNTLFHNEEEELL